MCYNYKEHMIKVIKMIERIQKNEERLDNALQSIKLLEEALSAFKKSKKQLLMKSSLFIKLKNNIQKPKLVSVK